MMKRSTPQGRKAPAQLLVHSADDESDAVEEADSSGEESTEERLVVTARRRGTSDVGESAGDTIIKLRSRSIKRSA